MVGRLWVLRGEGVGAWRGGDGGFWGWAGVGPGRGSGTGVGLLYQRLLVVQVLLSFLWVSSITWRKTEEQGPMRLQRSNCWIPMCSLG